MHAAFTAHGAPSVTCPAQRDDEPRVLALSDLCPSLHGLLSPLHRYHGTAFTDISMLIRCSGSGTSLFSSCDIQKPAAIPCGCCQLSTFRSPYHGILLGAALWTCMYDTAVHSIRTFITTILTRPHILPQTSAAGVFRHPDV